MKIDKKGYITLTAKEAAKTIDLLWTLSSMGGSFDDDFNKDCSAAQKIMMKMVELVETIKEERK